MREGLAAERDLDFTRAMDRYERAAAGPSGTDAHLTARARYTKQLSDLAWQTHAKHSKLNYCENTRPPALATRGEGIETARRALGMSEDVLREYPESSLAHVAVCANLGRVALYSSNRQKVRMSDRVLSLAERAVSLDPDDDMAWHALGTWHAHMAHMSVVHKLVIKLYYQGSCFNASNDTAHDAYVRAASLRPDKILHQVELAKSLASRGKSGPALQLLDQALVGPDLEDVNARLSQAKGQQLRDKLAAAEEKAARPKRRRFGVIPRRRKQQPTEEGDEGAGAEGG